MDLAYYTSVHQLGKNILVRGVTHDGERVAYEDPYCPKAYVRSDNKNEPFRTMHGEPLEQLDFEGIYQYKNWAQKFEGSSNFKTYGPNTHTMGWISDHFPTPDPVKWNPRQIIIANIDIETTCDNGFPLIANPIESITAITAKFSNDDIYHVFGCGEFDSSNHPTIKYYRCKTEIDLLLTFRRVWCDFNPDVMTGWNITFFDIPYMFSRITHLLGDKAIKPFSPWGVVRPIVKKTEHGELPTYTIMGVGVLDYLPLYKKFNMQKQASYRLDHISFVELKQRKLDYSEYDNLHTLYKRNYQKFIEYNVQDVALVDRLEQKKKFIFLAITMAYYARVNYDEVYSPVRFWESLIYNNLRAENVIPMVKFMGVSSGEAGDAYSGGFVKEVIPGAYEWILSFDAASLYPSLIMQYNISPETVLDVTQLSPDVLAICNAASVDAMRDLQVNTSPLVRDNVTVSPTGIAYTKEVRGIVPRIMDSMFTHRKQIKSDGKVLEKKIQAAKSSGVSEAEIDAMELEASIAYLQEQAYKIGLNSGYGAFANQFFQHFDVRNAGSVTSFGRSVIKFTEKQMNIIMNKLLQTEGIDYVIAVDTDSVYLNMAPFVEKYYKGMQRDEIVSRLNDISNKVITPYIQKMSAEYAEVTNAYTPKMDFKREVIAERGLWKAKKRYALLVWDKEGVRYKDPEMKIMGLQTQRSSTPAVAKKRMEETLRLILTSDEATTIAYINETRELFNTASVQDISFTSSANNLNHYTDQKTKLYAKGCPIHVRAAILYRYYTDKYGIVMNYPRISEGERIHYTYLIQPNVIGEDVFGYITSIPKELDLEESVDRNKQFQTAYLKPVDELLALAGWSSKNQTSLDDLFS
jgi:DNA polymerase elongation subunit (family B)